MAGKKARPESENDRPVGRPRTTLEDLPENWEAIFEEVGRDGGGQVEVWVELGISQSSFSTLMKDHAKFRMAEQKRQYFCEIWWERQGRRMVAGGDGNGSVWKFNMQNRFGWRERTENDHKSSDGTMSPERAKEEGNAVLEALQRKHKK